MIGRESPGWEATEPAAQRHCTTGTRRFDLAQCLAAPPMHLRIRRQPDFGRVRSWSGGVPREDTMTYIIEVLRQEHCNIESLLRVLERELSVFDRGERPDYEVVPAVIDYFKDY